MTGILNTRILASIAMLVFVGAVVASSTGAFFSDTETSTGNTFTAGEIDLKIDNSSYGFDWNDPTNQNPTGVWGPNTANSWALSDLTNQLFFSFDDLKPGDYGEDTISLHVQNDAYACMALDLTGTPENDLNEAEAEGLPVDATAGAQEGELQNYLNFAFWNDDGDNVYENNEGALLFSGLASALDGGWQAIAESGDAPLPAQTGDGVSAYIGKFWCFGTLVAAPVTPAENPSGPTVGNTGFTCDGSGNNNDAQTDGIVVDVEFYAVQSRNNGQFLCSSLNEPEVVQTTLSLEKVITQDQDSPVTEAAWTLTADGTLVDISGAEGDPAVTNAVVPAGDYVLSESALAGFTQTDLQCVGGTLVGNTVTVTEGSNVTCTFFNTEDTLLPN